MKSLTSCDEEKRISEEDDANVTDNSKADGDLSRDTQDNYLKKFIKGTVEKDKSPKLIEKMSKIPMPSSIKGKENKDE